MNDVQNEWKYAFVEITFAINADCLLWRARHIIYQARYVLLDVIDVLNTLIKSHNKDTDTIDESWFVFWRRVHAMAACLQENKWKRFDMFSQSHLTAWFIGSKQTFFEINFC